MASEIKIHLQTYLNDVGIKASQVQIEKLSNKLEQLNRKGQESANRTADSIGRLPGILGRVQKVLQSATFSVGSFFAAFMVGVQIGNIITDKILKPLGWIKDPIEELKKENRALKLQAEEAAKAWEDALNKWREGWNKTIEGAERAKNQIEDVTQAYLKMQKAIERVNAAQGKSDILDLEKQKADDVLRLLRPDIFDEKDRRLKLEQVGNTDRVYGNLDEQVEQVKRLYDIKISEKKLEQDLANFDRAAVVENKKLKDSEEALNKVIDRRSSLKRQLVEIDRKVAYRDSQEASDKYGAEANQKEFERLTAERAKIEERLYNAERDEKKRKDEMAAAEVAASALAKERENIKAQADLEIIEKKRAYDEYVSNVYKRIEDEWQVEQDQMRKAVATEQAERTRMEQALAAQRIDDLRKELAIEQNENRSAMSRQQAAESNLTTAWGYYRNQDRMQAVIDEKKAQEAAEAQWAKDFERLKGFRKDWRTAEMGSLSAADESVRQVALAKEEKEAADRAVIETAENTRRLADKLDELLQVKG